MDPGPVPSSEPACLNGETRTSRSSTTEPAKKGREVFPGRGADDMGRVVIILVVALIAALVMLWGASMIDASAPTSHYGIY